MPRDLSTQRSAPRRALPLDQAVELTRTGDVWVFRGDSAADRAIRALTNAPVNHVGMAVVLDDLPPLLWHAELGRSLPDVWTGTHQRGVQLHDLRDAFLTWRNRYGQRAWLRQLVGPADDGGVTAAMEDAVLRTIAREDGKPFPTTRGLVRGWGQVKVEGVDVEGADPMHVGGQLQVRARVHLGRFSPDDVEVQLFHGLVDSLGEIPKPHPVTMSTNGHPQEGSTWLFTGAIPCRSSGQHGFAVRVLPRNSDLASAYEPGLVCWG